MMGVKATRIMCPNYRERQDHMTDDTPLAGKGDQVAGKAKELAGKATGDDDLEAEGKGQQVEGHIHEAAHNLKEAAKGAVEHLTHRKESE
jgi:uncharacterized protein YjbJ (UPF0337 family)